MKMFLFLALALASYHLSAGLELFEGDIKMSDSVRNVVNGVSGYAAKLNVKWTRAEVPYVFARNFDQTRRGLVAKAIKDYNDNTCIRFIPKTRAHRDYVEFIYGTGCYADLGRQGSGRQEISIGDGCTSHGTILHEMMHAIGFFHEQSRRDRDNYITIYWQNIPKENRYNFEKYAHGEADSHGEPYDYGSVMHYGNRAFGIGGRVTISAKDNPQRVMGQRLGFSPIDLKQINKLYNCQQPPASCTDSDPRCPGWAKSGECSKNAAWMKDNCKKSCNNCPAACQDKHENCGYWSQKGECNSNPDYMLKACRKSCRQC